MDIPRFINSCAMGLIGANKQGSRKKLVRGRI
jgi:hypothetical protein